MSHDSPSASYETLHATAAESVALRRQFNQDLPIFQLPAELLIVIFNECRQEDDLYSRIRFLWQANWIACTHVCHYWRDIALAAPMLWSDVSVHPAVNEEAFRTWLVRSATSPVTMTIKEYGFGHMTAHPHFSEPMLDSITRGLSRTTSLDIAVGHDVMMSLRWPNTIPSLEELIVDITEHTITLDVHDTFSRRVATRFPGLKRYSANISTFDFTNWILPQTLTELYVSGLGTAPTYTLLEVVETLQRLPCLESLVMEDATPIDAPLADAAGLPVVLPSLRYLFLSGLIETQAAMLDVIKLSPSVRLTLDLTLHNNFEQAALLTRPSFSAYLRDIKAPRGVAMAVEDRSRGRHRDGHMGGCKFSFMAWSEPQPLESMQEPMDVDRDTVDKMPTLLNLSFFVFQWAPRPVPIASIQDSLSPLERLLSTFPLSDVRTLALCCTHGPVFKAPQVYNQMLQLHTLCFTSIGRMNGGLRDILQQIDLAEEMGDHTVIFPRLSVLALLKVQCKEAHQHLWELLKKRRLLLRASGAPFPDDLQVLLKDCSSLTLSDVEKLRQLAVVQWDGLGGPDGDDEHDDDEFDTDEYDDEE